MSTSRQDQHDPTRPTTGLLDDDYVGCLAGNLRAAARVVTRSYDDELRAHGVRITQIAVLARLARAPGATVTQLAAELAGERSAITRDVAVLERNGFVVGDVSIDDRRSRRLELTDLGRQTLTECAPAWRRAQGAMRDRLGDDQVGELVERSRRLVAGLSDSPDSGSPA